MKKVLICLLVAITLMNCEVKVQSSKADMTNIICGKHDCVTGDIVVYDNMKYLVFSSTHPYGMAPFAVNLTKDSLEVEWYRKQLSK